MPGTVVTFYSYKGGVGRTFTLANTAVLLATWGYRTLCIDWDLDAPGLSFYFSRWMEPARRGLVDLVDDYATHREPDPRDYVVPVTIPGISAPLHLLAAGSGDDTYVRRAQLIEWDVLYRQHELGAFLERCRDQWSADYDFVLIDSRTGITDVGGICTAQLPDILAVLFTANEQSLRGVIDVVQRAAVARDGLPYDRSVLLTLPVPSRFDGKEEYKRARRWQREFVDRLSPLTQNWCVGGTSVERLLGHLTVPYVSYWSFGEDLPAVGEPEPAPDQIGYSLQTVAAMIAHRLERSDVLGESRDAFVEAAAQPARGYSYDVFISYSNRRDVAVARGLKAKLAERSVDAFLADSDVHDGENWARKIDSALRGSRHLVSLCGLKFGSGQYREVEVFLRRTLNERSDGLVIPVRLPRANLDGLPTFLREIQAIGLVDEQESSLDRVADLIAATVRRARLR